MPYCFVISERRCGSNTSEMLCQVYLGLFCTIQELQGTRGMPVTVTAETCQEVFGELGDVIPLIGVGWNQGSILSWKSVDFYTWHHTCTKGVILVSQNPLDSKSGSEGSGPPGLS